MDRKPSAETAAAAAPASNQQKNSMNHLTDENSSADGDDLDLAMVKLLQIVVKRTGSGSEVPCLELSIEHGASVMDLKTLIQDELADESPCLMVPVERQRLIYSGRMLSDNEQKLIQDVKMTAERTNYVHLAPLPKHVAPTVRSRAENKLQARRLANRAHRMASPYNIGPRGNSSRTAHRGSNDRTPSPFLEDPQQRFASCSLPNFGSSNNHLVVTENTPLLQSLGLLLDNTRNSGLHRVPAEESLTSDCNALLPLCNTISSNITSLVSNQNHQLLQEARQEQTILLCEQLSQRSMSLARTLRQNLREERHRQLLSAHDLLQHGLSWGNH